MVLDSILTVAALASGATVTLPHGLDLVPTRIAPDRATPIGVQTVTPTTVTFINRGNQTESAFFACQRDHSIQQKGDQILYWSGQPASSFLLSEPQWTDLRIPLLALSAVGLNPPSLTAVANDGTVVPGTAVSFDGATNVGAVADFGDFGNPYSLSFWLNSSYAGAPARTILNKTGTIAVTLQSGSLRVALQGYSNTLVPGLLLGAKNHVAIVADEVPNANLLVYVNGVLQTNVVFGGALAADSAPAWSVMAANHAGVFDELRIYQAALSAAQVAELYNAGAGTEAEPTGAPTLLAGYHLNEGAGSTGDNYEGTAARDMSIAGVAVTWVAGLVGAAGSKGVYTLQFPPGVQTDVPFATEFAHDYLQGSNYECHLHVYIPVLPGNGSKLVLGVELQRAAIHTVYPPTTEVYEVTLTPDTLGFPAGTHLLIHDFAELSGAGMTISHVIRGRVYRKGTGMDAFPLPVYIDCVGFHYRLDTLGSRTETAK